MGLLPLGWQTVRLFTEYSAGKKSASSREPAPSQLTSVSNWEEYTQQNPPLLLPSARLQPMAPIQTSLPPEPSTMRRSGPFLACVWAEFGADEAAFACVCLRSRDHGADLSRRVASVSGNLWLAATDQLPLEGKSGGSHLLSPPPPP